MPEIIEMDKFSFKSEREKKEAMDQMVALKMLSNYGKYYVLNKDFRKSMMAKLLFLMEVRHEKFEEAFDKAKILSISEILGMIDLHAVMKYLTIVDSYITPEELNRLKTEVEKIVKKW